MKNSIESGELKAPVWVLPLFLIGGLFAGIVAFAMIGAYSGWIDLDMVRDPAAIILFTIFAGGSGTILFILASLGVRVLWDERGCEIRKLMGGKKCLKWDEVIEFKRTLYKELVFQTAEGRRVKMSPGWEFRDQGFYKVVEHYLNPVLEEQFANRTLADFGIDENLSELQSVTVERSAGSEDLRLRYSHGGSRVVRGIQRDLFAIRHVLQRDAPQVRLSDPRFEFEDIPEAERSPEELREQLVDLRRRRWKIYLLPFAFLGLIAWKLSQVPFPIFENAELTWRGQYTLCVYGLMFAFVLGVIAAAQIRMRRKWLGITQALEDHEVRERTRSPGNSLSSEAASGR